MVTADYSEGSALRAAVNNGVLQKLYDKMFDGVDLIQKHKHGKQKLIITPRQGITIGRDNKGYLRRKKSIDGVCYQVRLHSLYAFKKMHEDQENIQSGSAEDIFYRSIMLGESLVARGLDVSHLNHDKDDVLCLHIEPKPVNVSRSRMDCFDRLVCIHCDDSMNYPCPHNPRCSKDIEIVCFKCA